MLYIYLYIYIYIYNVNKVSDRKAVGAAVWIYLKLHVEFLCSFYLGFS